MVKTKCTYWAKCYRKDADHKKQFLHPGDEDNEIEELVKNAKPSKKHDLQGKRIVFTGTLTNASRKQAEARAKTFGCFVGAAVSKNIDLIIAGDEPGDKVDKAKKLGVTVYTEDEWENLLQQSKPAVLSKALSTASSKNEATAVASTSKEDESKAIRKRRKTHELSADEESQQVEKKKVSKKKEAAACYDGDTSDTDVEDTPSPPKKAKTPDEPEASTSGAVPKLTRSRSQSMSNKPRCKFWEKCYRTNDDHVRDFLHPHDLLKDSSGKVLVSSFEMPKNMTIEHDSDADTSSPLPKHAMKDGDTFSIKGGLRGELTYTIKHTGGHYYCTCNSWKIQTKPIDKRTCRHLKDYLGEEYEMYRIGKMTGGPGDEVITRAARHKAIGSLLLAHKWAPDVDPTGWWMSEKLDGVRAYWDGKTFYSRLGNEFIAPSWFIKNFPSHMTLDGELFGGRGKFQSTVSIVKTAGSGRWNEIKYYIFDAPETKKPFEGRLEAIHDYFDKKNVKTVTVLEHVKCTGIPHLKAEQKKVEDRGGEGLMIRQPKSAYEHRRSHALLKIKSFHDAEAKVIGYQQGKGRNASVMGAVVCLMECGKTFKVGSGFTDAQRRSPPKKGSIITYRFQEYTNSGSPRFPTYVGIRIDMDGPKDVILPKKS